MRKIMSKVWGGTSVEDALEELNERIEELGIQEGDIISLTPIAPPYKKRKIIIGTKAVDPVLNMVLIYWGKQDDIAPHNIPPSDRRSKSAQKRRK